MRTVLSLAILFLILSFTLCAADTVEQTDWSAGGNTPGPVVSWSDRFDNSTGLSWLALPGRLALSSTPLTPPVESLIDSTYAGAFGMAGVDIDKDGDVDVVGASDFSGVVSVWLNQGGSPVSWVEQVVDNTPSRPQAVYPADVDGDGNTDIVGNFITPLNQVVWWRNDGSDPIGWTRSTVDTGWTSCFEIHAEDLDGDGNTDIIATSWDLRDVAWWKNDGNDPIAWTKQTVAASFNGAHSVRCGDLDGDGDKDLVAVAGMRNQVAWWRNDGGDPITWVKLIIRNNFTGGRSVYPADIDRDGDLDIAGASWTSEISWWRNDGGDPVVWTEQVIDSTFNGGHSVEVADVNGDGHPDVLGAAFVDNDIYWYENDGGDPVTWTPHLVDPAVAGVISVRAADLDGDGAHEILGSAYNSGRFLWWDVVEFGASGELVGSILDTDGGVAPAHVDWTADTPSGTSLHFEVRSSNDPGNMGAWSSPISGPGLLAGPAERYFQYKVVMSSSDPTRSPVVDEVVFSDAVTGVTDAAPIPWNGALRASPNPFNPEVSIAFRIDRPGRVELSIYSAAGRSVRSLANGRFPAGVHAFRWDGLSSDGNAQPSGIYFARLDTDFGNRAIKLTLVR